jgi:hypothetical protein
MGLTEKQIARLTNTESVMLSRIDAVLNMGGSYLLYLLHVSSKTGLVESYIVMYPFLVVEPRLSKGHNEKVILNSCMHTCWKIHIVLRYSALPTTRIELRSSRDGCRCPHCEEVKSM